MGKIMKNKVFNLFITYIIVFLMSYFVVSGDLYNVCEKIGVYFNLNDKLLFMFLGGIVMLVCVLVSVKPIVLFLRDIF